MRRRVYPAAGHAKLHDHGIYIFRRVTSFCFTNTGGLRHLDVLRPSFRALRCLPDGPLDSLYPSSLGYHLLHSNI